MPDAKIRIARKNEKPVRPDGTKPGQVIGTDIGEMKIHEVILLEAGMESGRTSVIINLIDKDGKHHIAETSAWIWQQIAGAITGAEQRWKMYPLEGQN